MDTVKKSQRRDWFFSYNMIFSMNISCHAKIVYMFLCRCADSEAQSFPNKNTIAKNCSISVSSVKTALKELVEARLLSREEQYREDGSQTSNLFTIFNEPFETLEEEATLDNNSTMPSKKPTLTPQSEPSTKKLTQGQTKYDHPRSNIDHHPSQNVTTPQSKYNHQEVLPNISTIQKEVISVCQSVIAKNENGLSDEIKDIEKIKKQCEFHLFNDLEVRNMLENAVEIMYFSEFLQVGNARIPKAMVRSRMHGLHGAVLFYSLDKIKTKTGDVEKITNSTKYIISCIYNAISEYHSDVEVSPELNR